MGAIEFTDETKQQIERIGSADVLVGIAGAVQFDPVRAKTLQVMHDLGSAASSLRLVFAYPGDPQAVSSNGAESPAISLLPFSAPLVAGDLWSGVSAHQRAVLSLASSLNVKACIVLGADLAALHAHAIQLFAYAILDRQCGLAMPLYSTGKYDGLVNSGILSPLSRALYGKRVRFPLAYEFAVAGGLCDRMAHQDPGYHVPGNSLLWPVTVAATQFPHLPVGQVHLHAHHPVSAGGLDLSAVLSQIVGSLFQEMDVYAANWQRVRGSQITPMWGSAPAEQPEGPPPDPQPMLDSFLLGSRNLDELWKLILPPNTLLELRRLTRQRAESFRMPDELWAGIVYDFALAWRLRTLSRAHLLGALTPLYLGWVASYVREAAPLPAAAAEQRLEQMARGWEEKKPYLLSRWRWPDRFNP
jgi:hypothetical protein